MLFFLSALICFLASVIGAICGIGGGVIIKPVLDAYGIMEVPVISFLSGCTVLSMTSYSVIKGRLSGKSHIHPKIGLSLAIGATVGGLTGKEIFSFAVSFSPAHNQVGAIQAACLLLVTVGTLLYTIYKERIPTYKIVNPAACIFIGMILGTLSSFLGIGGGPINLVILFFFFSMSTKKAAENSLYIIFFSQTASLLSSLLTGTIPPFPTPLLILMIICGIAGGIVGRAINAKISDLTTDKLFIGIMTVIIFINAYNIYRFSA